MTPQQKLLLAHDLVRRLAIDSGNEPGDVIHLMAAKSALPASAPLKDVFLLAQALGWLNLNLDGNTVKSMALTQAGQNAAFEEPGAEPVGIGVYRNDDGDIVAVLVRYPNGDLEIVAIDSYAFEPPAEELPVMPSADWLDLGSRPNFGM